MNIWNYKPWWCQPWSIILTGSLAITMSWLITKIVWLTVGVSLLIFLWWLYFLVLYPKAFEKMLINKDIEDESNQS